MLVSDSFAVVLRCLMTSISCVAGLVPVMMLAEQTGLSRAAGHKVVSATEDQVGGGQPRPEAGRLGCGDVRGRGCIDDVDAVRSGG